MIYLNYLSKLDRFGLQYQVRGQNGQKGFQSLGGGIVSLAIYTLSLMYFVYILHQWQSGQIDPSSSSFSEISNKQIFDSGNQSIFEMSFWKQEEDDIDPFSDQTLIYIPIFFYEINGIPQEPKQALKSQYEQKSNSFKISFNNIQVILDDNSDGLQFKEPVICIIDCQQKYLLDGQKCASQEVIDKFNQQANYLAYFNKLQTYNTKIKQLQTFQNDQYVPFDLNLNSQFIVVQLNSVNQSIEDGIIFSNRNYIRFIDSVSIVSQYTSESLNMKTYGFNYKLSFILRLNPIIQQVSLRYQNLGEIFAMVGSIASVLMSIGILVEQLNGFYQDNLLVRSILENYFPKKIQTNKLGQIVNIKGLQDMKQVRGLQEIAESKLNILNIIYQISRIELFLIQKYGRNEIIQTNDFIIQTNQFEDSVEINSREPCQFFIEDINLLTYPKT